jgi:hypothetical protein
MHALPSGNLDMNAAAPDAVIEEEIDLELDRGDAQRTGGRQQTSSSLLGTVEYRSNKVSVRIDDLSIGGVGVTVQQRLPIGEDCRLVIHFSVCGSDYELEMKSRIRHCDALNSKTFHAGLQFVDMSQSTRDTLTLLIK